MQDRQSRRFAPFLLAVPLLLTLACSGASAPVEETLADDAIREIPARWSVANAASVETLVDSSDAVFIGTVTRQTGQRDEALRPTSVFGPPVPGKPAPDASPGFPMSVFELRVTEPLVGDLVAGQLVTVEQPGGLTPVSGRDVRVVLWGDTPLTPGQRYLFFATVKPNGAYSAAPFARMPIDDGLLSVDAKWDHLPALAGIAGARVDEVAREIHDVQ